MASAITAFFDAEIDLFPFSAYETVLTETPARAATSFMVATSCLTPPQHLTETISRNDSIMNDYGRVFWGCQEWDFTSSNSKFHHDVKLKAKGKVRTTNSPGVLPGKLVRPLRGRNDFPAAPPKISCAVFPFGRGRIMVKL
jgi:hypothetical protein